MACDKRCQRATGHSIHELKALESFVLPYLLRVRLDGELRVRKRGSGKLADHLQLFVYLFYCRTYPYLWHLAWQVGEPERYLQKVLRRVSVALSNAASDPALDLLKDGAPKWPTRAELADIRHLQRNMYNPGLEGHDFVIDGMFVRVPVPAQRNDKEDLRPRLWSRKKGAFGVDCLRICTLQGLIVYLTGPSECGEQATLRDSEVRQWLRDHEAGILSDALFTFNYVNDTGPRIKHGFTVGPKTLKRLKDTMAGGAAGWAKKLALQSLHSTRSASQMRIVVENRIGRTRHWAILDSRFRQYGHDGVYSLRLEDVELGIEFLINRQVLLRPCRADTWQPKGLDTPGATYGYPDTPLRANAVSSWAITWLDTDPATKNAVVDTAPKFAAEPDEDYEEDSGEGYEDEDYVYDMPAPPKPRAQLDSRREHVVAAQYGDLDRAERLKRKRKA